MRNLAIYKLLLSFIVTANIFSPCFSQKKALTLDQIIKNKFPDIVIPLPQFVSWKDDSHLIFDKRFYPDTALKTIIINAKTGQETIVAKDFSPRPEGLKKVYLKDNDLFYSYNNVETRLTDNKEPEMNPVLSPDSSQVAFTRNNNLYVVNLVTRKETPLTSDGNDSILNGYASWVYMEEILEGYTAFWWSPDSRYIAFFCSDDSPVPVFTITDANGQHGYVKKQRYPKAGDKNPEIKIGIISLDDHHTTWADFNEHDDQYFGPPLWRPDGSSLLVQWMNRDQNTLGIYDINIQTGAKKEFYSETQKTWTSFLDGNSLQFLPGGKGVIILTDKSGWAQLYLHDVNGKLVNPLTSGSYSVTRIIHTDQKKQLLYFTARKENSTRADLYRVRLDGKELKRLTFGEYNHEITMSPSGSYFLTNYSNVSTPTRIALLDNNGKLVKEIANSKGPEFGNYDFAQNEILRVKSEDGLFDLPVAITWPMNMDKNKRYPVYINIYGGPNAGSVYDTWFFLRQMQLFASEGMIVIFMDHRGSGQFGKQGADYMYHNLGYWEMKDYSTVVKWLVNKGYADPKKILISGYSYGGYLTCYALTYGADVFTLGMAGSSVTDWSLYDTHYTERYMGTPANNPEGYKSSSVLTHADKYKGRLMMTHGVVDDNVHMQNSMQLNSRLQDLKKDFDFYIYSAGTHMYMEPNKQMHWSNARTLFLYKYLLEKPVPEGLLR
ncbi:MAG: DPP IV N-terminal domain-containing protein [Candidatus Dadabacteria bacterium]